MTTVSQRRLTTMAEQQAADNGLEAYVDRSTFLDGYRVRFVLRDELHGSSLIAKLYIHHEMRPTAARRMLKAAARNLVRTADSKPKKDDGDDTF